MSSDCFVRDMMAMKQIRLVGKADNCTEITTISGSTISVKRIFSKGEETWELLGQFMLNGTHPTPKSFNLKKVSSIENAKIPVAAARCF